VTIQLGTPNAATGDIAIGNDGTMAWIESDGEVAQVWRRSPEGEIDLVVEHAMERPSTPTVMDDGTVLVSVRNPASARSDVYVEDLLVYTEQKGPLVHRSSGFVSALWTGSGYGEIAEYDVLTGSGQVHALPQEYDGITLLASDGAGLVFLRIDSADPVIAGFYFWEDGQLTREEVEDPPESIRDFVEFAAYGSADMSGNQLVYTYKVRDGNFEKWAIIVVKDLVTSQSSVYAIDDTPPYAFGGARIDALGRVYYGEEVQPDIDLIYIQEGVFRGFAYTNSWIWDINSVGRGVVTTPTIDCDTSAGANDPDCAENIAHFDVDAGSYRQLTEHDPYTFIVAAYINDSDDIIFAYTDQDHLSQANPAAPMRTATASVIDTRPPTAPSGLVAASRTQSAIDLAWNASSDAVGLGGYDVFRDNALVATVEQPGYRDAGLDAATSYTYRVEAFDLAGNRTASAPVILSTQGATPPPPPGGGGSLSVLILAVLAMTGLSHRFRRGRVACARRCRC